MLLLGRLATGLGTGLAFTATHNRKRATGYNYATTGKCQNIILGLSFDFFASACLRLLLFCNS
jgi:hypothetical protein